MDVCLAFKSKWVNLSGLILKETPPVLFCKKNVFLKNFAIFTGKHLCWSHFLTKLQGWKPAIFLKRDSNTGVFLWKLRNFSEHLWKTSANGCYCSEIDNSSKEKDLASCSLCNSPVLRSTILSKKINVKIKILAKFKSESLTIHNSDILSHAQSPVWQGDESNKSFLKLSHKNARIKNETLIMSWKKINVVLACRKINI